MNKNIIFLFAFIFIFNFVLAVPPVTTSFQADTGLDIQANVLDYYKINTSAELHIFVFNISNGKILDNNTVNCTAELTDKNGEMVMIGNPSYHLNHFIMMRNSSVVSQPGVYGLTIFCESDKIGGVKTSYFEATNSGEEKNIEKLLAYLFLILVMIILIFLVKYNHNHTDFDNWDSEIKSKHKNGHMGQTMTRSIIYNLFKNTFLWYYLLGWLILLVSNNIVVEFLEEPMIQYFTLIANVYSLGFLLVVTFIIGHTYSYIKNTLETLSDDNWGLGE